MALRITDLLALSHVPRWSIVRRTREQYVGDHTYRMMVITKELFDRLQIPMGAHVWYYVLIHDAMECRTADIPTTAKNHVRLPEPSAFLPWLANADYPGDLLTPSERQLVKLADMIEAYTWIGQHGTGIHANRVGSQTRIAILAETDSDRMLQGVVETLIAHIMSDEGRFEI